MELPTLTHPDRPHSPNSNRQGFQMSPDLESEPSEGKQVAHREGRLDPSRPHVHPRRRKSRDAPWMPSFFLQVGALDCNVLICSEVGVKAEVI